MASKTATINLNTLKNITISIDTMSGDHGVPVTVAAAISAVESDDRLHTLLVGDKDILTSTLTKLLKSRHAHIKNRIAIHHASEVVEMDESPALVLRKKKDSSMRVAINLVKEGKADAAVSAGNTGALMATARFVLKMLPGIERPAICTELPTEHGSVFMLDLGANVDSSPEMLLQFAYMGAELCSASKQIEKPRIGLLNVGSEEIKGSATVKAAAELLTKADDLNYVGYVEGDEIFTDKCDVVTCDGFEGNIALKTAEGVARLINTITKEEFTKSPFRKLAALCAYPVFKNIKARLDPRSYNGATLVGLRGVVVKSHGGADAVSFVSAINVAVNEITHDLPQRIEKKILSHSE